MCPNVSFYFLSSCRANSRLSFFFLELVREGKKCKGIKKKEDGAFECSEIFHQHGPWRIRDCHVGANYGKRVHHARRSIVRFVAAGSVLFVFVRVFYLRQSVLQYTVYQRLGHGRDPLGNYGLFVVHQSEEAHLFGRLFDSILPDFVWCHNDGGQSAVEKIMSLLQFFFN